MASERRSFLKKGLIGGALLVVGGSTGLVIRRTLVKFTPGGPLKFLTPEEFSIYAAFADRVIPGGKDHLPASKLQVAEKCDAVMARAEPVAQKEFKQLLQLFDNALASFAFDFRITPFTQLTPEAQDRAIDQWRRSRITLRRTGYQALKRLACACYYGSPETYAGVGYAAPTRTTANKGTTTATAAEHKAEAVDGVTP